MLSSLWRLCFTYVVRRGTNISNAGFVLFSCTSQDAMDGGALQNLVGFLRKKRGQAGIVYCHKVGAFSGIRCRCTVASAAAASAAAASDVCYDSIFVGGGGGGDARNFCSWCRWCSSVCCGYLLVVVMGRRNAFPTDT